MRGAAGHQTSCGRVCARATVSWCGERTVACRERAQRWIVPIIGSESRLRSLERAAAREQHLRQAMQMLVCVCVCGCVWVCVCVRVCVRV